MLITWPLEMVPAVLAAGKYFCRFAATGSKRSAGIWLLGKGVREMQGQAVGVLAPG